MLQEQDIQAIARLIDERATKTEDKFLNCLSETENKFTGRLEETENKFTGRLEETEEYFNTRLEEMETRFDAKFQKTESRLDSMKERFECVEYRLDGIDTRLDKMDKRFDEMQQHFDARLIETADELYEEIGITQVYLEKKIDKIGNRVEDIWQLCRINKVENDRILLLVKSLDKRVTQIEDTSEKGTALNV